jgi:hypothetical protein
MNERPGKRGLHIVEGLGVLALIAIIAFAAVTLTAGSSAPNDKDMTAITDVIARWNALTAIAPPAQYAEAAELPKAVSASIDADYRAAVNEVGTPEFASSLSGLVDRSQLFERGRASGYAVIKEEQRVLDVTFKRNLDNGDVVVWAKLWHGETSLLLDTANADAAQGTQSRVDSTPVNRYQMRNVNGEWKIVTEATIFESEDTSAEYGPDTPHWVAPAPSWPEDQGLILDTPAPSAQ